MKRGKGPQMDSDPRSRPGYNPFPSTYRQRESRREGKDSKGYVDPNVAHPLDHRLGAGYQNERAWANMAEDGRLRLGGQSSRATRRSTWIGRRRNCWIETMWC